jgi:hypothetical protein
MPQAMINKYSYNTAYIHDHADKYADMVATSQQKQSLI